MSARQNPSHLQVKNAVITALVAGAALSLFVSGLSFLKDPSGIYRLEKSSLSQPETLNFQLNWLRGVLAPLERLLPADTPLRYVGPEEAFDYFQAVLAPRRISPNLDSNFLLVYDNPPGGGAEIDLRGASPLFRLDAQIQIMTRRASH